MTIQGAIAELQNLLGADDIPLYYKPAIEKVIETIVDELPSADRPEGHWIERERCYDVAECSVCGRIIIFDADDDSFCPNCGADMRGDEE